MIPFYQDDLLTLYCGNCIDIVPQLDVFDLLLTDPPYGMTENSGRRLHAYKDHKKHKGRIGWSNACEIKDYDDDFDSEPMTKDAWTVSRKASKIQCVWGFNHLMEILGKPPRMLVWDKKCKNGWDDYFSDLESA